MDTATKTAASDPISPPEPWYKASAEAIESIASALKSAVFAILLVLLFIPPITKRILTAYGLRIQTVSSKDGIVLTSINEAKSDATTAGDAISSTTQQLNAIHDTVQQAAANARDPQVKQQLEQVLNSTDAALKNNRQAETSVSSAILKTSAAYSTAQQTTASSASSSTPTVSEGWLYLGRTNPDQTQWRPTYPLNVVSAALPLKNGQQLVLAGPALLRDDVPQGAQHSTGRVVGAVPANAKLSVTDVYPSHAVGGDYFEWIKVRVQG